MATILTQMQYTGFVAVYFYFILLSLPSFDRLSSWSHVQFRLFASQGCNLSPLFYIEDNLRNTQEEWFLGVFAVYLLGAIIFGVVRKRYMSQPQVAAETQDASAVR